MRPGQLCLALVDPRLEVGRDGVGRACVVVPELDLVRVLEGRGLVPGVALHVLQVAGRADLFVNLRESIRKHEGLRGSVVFVFQMKQGRRPSILLN